MLLELFAAPSPAHDDQPYVPGHKLTFAVESVTSVAQDTTNRAWCVVFIAQANGTYAKVIVGMNYEQVVKAWHTALREYHFAKHGGPVPVIYDPRPDPFSADPNWGRGVGIGGPVGRAGDLRVVEPAPGRGQDPERDDGR